MTVILSLHCMLPGKRGRRCWCTVRWACRALRPQWWRTWWSSRTGPWRRLWCTCANAGPSCSLTTASCSSCTPTAASSVPGIATPCTHTHTLTQCIHSPSHIMSRDSCGVCWSVSNFVPCQFNAPQQSHIMVIFVSLVDSFIERNPLPLNLK